MAPCFFGALESRVLRDVFIVNMTNREAQNVLCRATKTPEDAYRIALSAEYKSICNRWESFEVDTEIIGGEEVAKCQAEGRTERA